VSKPAKMMTQREQEVFNVGAAAAFEQGSLHERALVVRYLRSYGRYGDCTTDFNQAAETLADRIEGGEHSL